MKPNRCECGNMPTVEKYRIEENNSEPWNADINCEVCGVGCISSGAKEGWTEAEGVGMWNYINDGWVSCENALPEEESQYLCYQQLDDGSHWREVCTYTKKDGFYSQGRKVEFGPSHWRDLPESP